MSVCRRYPCLCVSAAVVVLFAGCFGSDGPPTAPVMGVVTYNGQPVENAGVMFSPAAGRPAIAQTNANGEFVLSTRGSDDGALLGEHTVTIVKIEARDPDQVAIAARSGRRPPPPRNLLPAKYADARQSGLKATVTESGPNEFRFELTD